MIYGIGTDIVGITRMEEGLARFGEKFARRILTDEEFAGFLLAERSAHFLARRFAVKEAVVKALGTGFRDGISMQHITLEHDALGKPLLNFSGRLQELMLERGVGEGFVSVSDEREYAIAYVILCRPQPLK
ncbi:MAG: holo-ACP synthase [Gammaproteobacteria bacterium RBG_16_57_12]|nr:MAG: holo-ACP synthase [Gammaproteobacteria bacterium RBG_16_57_12]